MRRAHQPSPFARPRHPLGFVLFARATWLVVASGCLCTICRLTHVRRCVPRLDELVSQNAAKKSTWKWYHVLGLILLNNIVVMVRASPAFAARAHARPVALPQHALSSRARIAC